MPAQTKVIYARIKVEFDYNDAIPVVATVSISDEHAEVIDLDAFRADGDELHYKTIQAIEEMACDLAFKKINNLKEKQNGSDTRSYSTASA